eukprot:gene5300-6600_t
MTTQSSSSTSLLKLCFSTDFEVHRNWLAITSSLPISKWYFEDTSEWTLDYPPFFAWFEYGLSKFASLVDPSIIQLDNLNYKAPTAILFQRCSVIISDLLFISASLLLSNYLYSDDKQKKNNESNRSEVVVQQVPWYQDKEFLVFLFVVLNPGLLMVDHVHFQYNGFLKGILVLSMYWIISGRILLGSAMFSILLNFKHIYMYMAPAYFIYLLKYYCFNGPRLQILSFIALGSTVLSVFSISLGPFILMKQIPQLLSRLFPFGRGLSHAYWAPNFWAVYNFIDRVSLFVGVKFLGWNIPLEQQGMLTSGLVGSETQAHVILPTITPTITLLITLLFLIPSLYGIFKSNSKNSFILGIVQSSFTFYMFGWHVHEKAIIMVTVPLGFLLLASSGQYSKLNFFLSTIGHYSLFPLLFETREIPTRILILLTYTLFSYLILSMTVQITIHFIDVYIDLLLHRYYLFLFMDF